MQDNISKLYSVLKDTYELGSEEDFRKYLGDSERREALRKELADEYEVGDSVAFNRYLGFDVRPYSGDFTMRESEVAGKPEGEASGTVARQPQAQPVNIPSLYDVMEKRPQYQPKPILEKEVVTDEEGNRVRRPKLQQTMTGGRMSEIPVVRDVFGNEYDPTELDTKEMVRKQTKPIPNTDEEEREKWRKELEMGNDPSLIDTVGKSIGAGFVRVGAGLVDVMEQLTSGLYVESGNGDYIRTASYDERIKDDNDPLTKASAALHDVADRMSAEAQPYGGKKGFLDLLWNGELGKAMQKGVATAGESLPMTLSWANPYTATVNAISMAGGNYRRETLENPDVPAWKRASYAIGEAAIEQAVEKYSDPFFKYVGGARVLKRAGKDSIKKFAKDVTRDAAETISKRIYRKLAGLTKDAAGEGAEEVIGNFGNDILGQALDFLNGDNDYGFEAQWTKVKKENPDADLWDFSIVKAKENVESFIGGAMAGAYTSGTTQASIKALEYATKRSVGDSEPVEPVELEIGQSFDEGYALEGQEMNDAKNWLELQQQRIGEIADDNMMQKLREKPMAALDFIRTNPEWTDEERQTALDYVNAKATYDGMLQHVKDDIVGRISESDRLISERRSKTDGMIHPATMKAEERKVYVVDGNVMMTSDGTMIDVEKSDESVIVRDAETGELSFVSAHDILSVGESIDADEEMQAARQAIRQEFAQAAADKIDGRLPFNYGDVYDVIDEEGQQHTIEIVPYPDADAAGAVPEGSVLVSVDGAYVPQVMSRNEIQNMADAYNLTRLAEYEQAKAAQTVEQAEENGLNVQDGQSESDVAPVYDAMPMIGEGENAEPDFMAVTPERAHSYLYNEAGLSRDEANQFVDANKKTADKELEKAKKGKPKMGTSLAKYKKEQSEYQQKIDAAQQVADYWQSVKDAQQRVLSAELDARAAEDAANIAQAQQEEQLRQEEELSKLAAQAALGTNNVAPAIREKWDAAPKVEGARNEIVLANGERVPGKYVIVESGAATPSHNPRAEFAKNEGFPVDENGQSVNDRDYEGDKDAQTITRQIASNYDQRALQSPVVVTNDGVVLSGNGRTMAGELAARDNTDGAYIGYLLEHPELFGFTKEQVESMAHPRVLFVPDEAMPYTADTFAKFNQQEMKGQSKTEQAVKLGKLIDDEIFGRIVRMMNLYDTLGEFYNDTKAATQAINELRNAGAISAAQYTEMFDGDAISAQGREILENMLIGKAFESNSDAVREITAIRSMRQSIITALSEISNNIMLGEGYSLESELSQAIGLVYKARKEGGYKAGDRVNGYARQGNLFAFDEGETVADYTNETVMMLADVINDNRTTRLKKCLSVYNSNAAESAKGQMDLFTGDVATKQEIINQVNILLSNGTDEEIKQQLDTAAEQRRTESVQQDGTDGNGNGSNDVATGQGDLAQTEAIELSDEVDENGRQFVLTSDGNIEFGRIEAETGLTPAPILLSEGIITNPETNDGYGLVHIEARHGNEIRKAGYNSVVDFIEEVAKNYEVIREGNTRDGIQTYMLQLTDKHNNTLMVELSGDGTYWNINTAGIFKTSYGAKRNVVYNRHTTDKQPTETAEASLSGEQSGTTPSTSMSAPTQTSADKGTEISANEQGKQENSVSSQQNTSIAAAEAEVNTNPTEAQKEAGNYKKGHITIDGYDITIENPKGSVRSGVDASGKQWRQTMHNTYGYIRGTEGVDGDHIDVFLSDAPESGNVYVIDQRRPDGSFDEHKVMYGFNSAEEARDAYLSNYEEGWQGLGAITGVSKEEFKKWVDSSHRKTKPFAEYRNVKVEGAQNEEQPNTAASGPFGTIYTQFKGKAKEAIDWLKSKKEGEAADALHHHTVGDISLVWGDAKTGLAKIVKKHPEVLDNLQDIIDSMEIVQESDNRIKLESDTHFAVVSKEYKGEPREKWLLTSYEKKETSEPANSRMDVESNLEGKSDDTATRQDSDVSGGKVTNNSASDQENGVKSYKISAFEYTTKRGKKLNMQLVTFESDLSKEQMNAAKKLAKDLKGWWSKDDGGFLMRDAESAQQLAESVYGDEAAVADAQPVTLEDMKLVTAEPVAEQEEGFHGGDTVWSSKHGENKHILMAHRMEVDGRSFVQSYSFTDGTSATAQEVEASHEEERDPRWHEVSESVFIEQKKEDIAQALAKDKAVVGTLAADNSEDMIRNVLEERISRYITGQQFDIKNPNHIVLAKQMFGDTGKSKEENAAIRNAFVDDIISRIRELIQEQKPKRLVSDERMEELKERLRKKMFGQLNVGVGVDPEILAIGAELAIGHIERGLTKFANYAKTMIDDLGDAIRPYLKAFYNAVRDMPEAEEYAEQMDSYDDVRKFDVANFDKNTTNAMATADMVVKETQAEQQAEAAIEQIRETRNNNRNEAEQQTEANTQAVADEAAAVASETESVVSSGDAAAISEQVSKIDEQLEKVNKQLALLGYYEADDSDPSKFHESYGYMKTAEKKALADAEKLAKAIAAEIGVDLGRKRVAKANIAPIGGDVTFRIPLSENRELYVDVSLNNDNDNLNFNSCMYRIEDPTASGMSQYISSNEFFYPNATMDDVLAAIKRAIRYHAPDFEIREKVKKATKKAETTENKPKSKKKAVPLQQEQQLDLFGDLFADLNEQASETSNSNNNETTDVQSRTEEEGRGGHEPQQDAQVGRSAGHEAEGTDGRGMGGRSSRNSLSDRERSLGVSGIHQGQQHVEPDGEASGTVAAIPDGEASGMVAGKNANNNHAERGKDYAPKGVDARIEANIKAIELMQQLILEGKQAAPAQMKVLRQYSGWGGLGKAFNENPNGPYSYNPTPRRLKELLGDDAYEQANMSRNSAYYTPAMVIDTMWDIARAMGFKGGTVLEGSAGIGNIIGAMPTDMSKRSDIHAVEIDETTGNILSLLYPDAQVEVQGFEATKVANGSVDLAITNVPFVTGLRVLDTTGDKDLSKKFHDIHDFCIAKNVRKLREGGIGIFITSNGTLDNSQKLRNWLVNEGGADVVGAFRLHNETFGGTGATSDIIVIRKRVNGQKSSHAIDVSTVTVERTGTFVDEKQRGKERTVSMDYNKYFIEHPECMAGEMHFAFEKGDTYRATSKALYPAKGKNQGEMLAEWIKGFEGMKEENQRRTSGNGGNVTEKQQDTVYESMGADVKEGSLILDRDGKLCVAQYGKAVPLSVNANKVKGHTKAECFQSYQAIKSALADVLAYQTENEGDEGLKPLLDKLNKAYDDFVKTYGHLHKNTSISFLKNDVDFPNILALENHIEEGDKNGNKVDKFEKTDIFKQRVVEKDKTPEPKNVKDGIIASIYQYGRIDVPYIADKLGKSVDDVKQEIVSSGLGFENPNTLQMEVSYEYLSGNVREKLRQAEEANEGGKYAANIEALRKVIPMDIPAHLIDFTLGSSWVELKLYEDYIKERTDVEAQLTNVGGTWYMKVPYYVQHEKNKAMGVRGEVVKKLILGSELIEAALQNKTITVSETRSVGYGSSKTTETITDKEATQACAAKIDEIRADFKEWARQKMQTDSEMSARMEKVYNDQFNNYVPVDVSMDFVPKYFFMW